MLHSKACLVESERIYQVDCYVVKHPLAVQCTLVFKTVCDKTKNLDITSCSKCQYPRRYCPDTCLSLCEDITVQFTLQVMTIYCANFVIDILSLLN